MSFVQLLNAHVKEQEKGFNLSHCSTSEHGYRRRHIAVNEASKKGGAYMRHYIESC